jgi:hypothetical protein
MSPCATLRAHARTEPRATPKQGSATLLRVIATLLRVIATLLRVIATLLRVIATLLRVIATLLRVIAALLRVGVTLLRVGATLSRAGTDETPTPSAFHLRHLRISLSINRAQRGESWPPTARSNASASCPVPEIRGFENPPGREIPRWHLSMDIDVHAFFGAASKRRER